jgi:molybdenum cofactor cytidylyltransferase
MNLVAIVLAAGSAKRFGSDKLSATFRGEPLVHHAIRAARAAPVSRVLVVCRPALATGTWDGPPPVERIEIESDAQSSSLKAGITAAGDADGAFIFLGDMPLIPHNIAARLAGCLKGNFAALPRCEGQGGHPVLLSSRAFGEIAQLEGDEGAGKLLKQRPDVIFDECTNCRIHLDVDRPSDFEKLEGLARVRIDGQGY